MALRSDPFAEDELSCDGFLDGRLRVWQPKAGYRAAVDPVLLAASAPVKAGEAVLELGCGAGVASLCLAARVEGLRQCGLELQPAYAELAMRNAAANGIGLTVHIGDLALVPAALRAESFDHVIANPPYFRADDGTAARDTGRETARREATPLSDWVSAAKRRLRPGGWLTIVQSTDRLPALLSALGAGWGSTAVLPVAPRQGRPAKRFLLQSRKGGRGAFRLCAPFVLHEGERHLRDGDDLTKAARAILRDGAALPF